MTSPRQYHIGFGRDDLPEGTSIALLSGDPHRSELIAMDRLGEGRALARNRGLDSFLAELPSGRPVVASCARARWMRVHSVSA